MVVIAYSRPKNFKKVRNSGGISACNKSQLSSGSSVYAASCAARIWPVSGPLGGMSFRLFWSAPQHFRGVRMIL